MQYSRAQKKNWNHPKYITAEIGLDPEKIPEDQRTFAVSQTPIEKLEKEKEKLSEKLVRSKIMMHEIYIERLILKFSIKIRISFDD